MKKFISIILIMVLALSLSVTAFAAGETGSITINNATVGKEYKIFKIFDAANSARGNGISYSINAKTDADLFKALFGEDGKESNQYLTYVPTTNDNKPINKNEDVNDSELIDYLTKLVVDENVPVSKTDTMTASTTTIEFEDLPFGYYLVTSALGAAVTIDSVTSEVVIIDKNQKPGVIDKQVATGAKNELINTPEVFAEESTANIGDLVTYRITFDATNYDGDQIIKYYQVNDVKGEGIWAEFDSFTVKVGDKELKKGYYLPVGEVVNTGEWKWFNEEAWTADHGNDKTQWNRNNADWYLVHLSFDEFRITIPWLEGHELEGDDSVQKPGPYTLEFPENSTPKFSAEEAVEIYYEAAVEPIATIGGTAESNDTNLYNTARLSWVTPHDVFSGARDRVVTKTYGIGLIKEDSVTRDNLKDAVFEIYRDEAHKEPVYVIPTDIDGVYIVDSLHCPSVKITGAAMKDARELYGTDENGNMNERLSKYLDGKTQKNEVVSQVNGRLVILGLKDGDYYLVETNPPSGYKALREHKKLTVDKNTTIFTVFANEEGKVADIQQTDGVYAEKNFSLTTVTVQNSKGDELPSTGAEGTFWMITIGTFLAIGFAIFLITHKKMSVYTD